MSKFLNPGLNVVGGIVNSATDILSTKYAIDQEKKWWYEQQKYIEEHNDPARQMSKMRNAGLNPFSSDIKPQPIGNVDSSLPRISAKPIELNAINQSMLTDAQRQELESKSHLQDVEAGLTSSKILTEESWRNQIIAQASLIQQQYQLGLISEERMRLELGEYRTALENGYNSYLIQKNLDESLISLNEARTALSQAETDESRARADESVTRANLNVFNLYMAQTFESLERFAQIRNINLQSDNVEAVLNEFLATTENRQLISDVEAYIAQNRQFLSDLERENDTRELNIDNTLLDTIKTNLESGETGKFLSAMMLYMLRDGSFATAYGSTIDASSRTVNTGMRGLFNLFE